MSIYWVYGHKVINGSKCKYRITAGRTLEAINEAYKIGGKYYTLDKVFNEDHSLLMADDRMIYNRR